jgi:hypothetical protein
VVVVTAGPFETEREARAAVAPAPGRPLTEINHRLLCEALAAAGVELGTHDHCIVQWLAGWEPSTWAAVAGLITRAHKAGGAP